jgi:tRNA pseudouridine38-40 synthase
VAGRTDAGVHAEANVVSFDIKRAPTVVELNARLPADLAAVAIEDAEPDFDARAEARSRSYVYRIRAAQATDPFRARYELHHPHPIDRSALDACARAIAGRHDFRAFTPTETRHVFFERTVRACEWVGDGDRLEFRITADALLRHMVRTLVGTMLERPEPALFQRLLEGAPRALAGRTARPHGLTLVAVTY